MSSMPERLAVIDSCDGCGACCQVVSRPPFYRVFDESGEDAWERLRADRPELVAEFLRGLHGRGGQPAVRFTALLVSGSTGIPGNAGTMSIGLGRAENSRWVVPTVAMRGGGRDSMS